MKKRLTAITMCLVLAVTLFTGCGGGKSADSNSNAAATVFKNGVIYTVEGDDWDKNAAESMAVSADGEILFVGSNADAEKWTGSNTEVVDLEGKTVLPGLIDAHVHPPGKALTELYQIDLYTAFSKDATIDTITEFIKKNPGLDAYWGSGFNMGMVDEAGNPPNKAWLDAVCPDIPMILTSNDGHNDLLNSAALKAMNITADSKQPTGGNIHKDAKGEPTGLLTDCGDLITMSQEYTPEQMNAATMQFLKSMNAWGYTSFLSAGSSLKVGDFKKLEDEGKLTMRANLSVIMDPDDPDTTLQELTAENKAAADSKMIKARTAKFFVDGVVEGATAYLLDPYTKAAGKGGNYRSEAMWKPDVMAETMKKVMAAGYQVHIHAIGDAGIRQTLDSIEYAQKANGDGDYRSTITHLQVISEQDKPRFGQLKVIAATQPYWHLKEPAWYSTVDELVLGKDRAWKEYPLKSLKDSGALITASGDFPVSPVNNPFWAIEAGVTRNLENADYYGVPDITDINDPTWLLNPEERLPVKDMVEAYTKNGAYELFRENEVGTLKEGKKADFIVIDQDIMKTDPLKLDSIKVLDTYLNGKAVYSAEQ
jgi:predicted amidohydrolase YtcJ